MGKTEDDTLRSKGGIKMFNLRKLFCGSKPEFRDSKSELHACSVCGCHVIEGQEIKHYSGGMDPIAPEYRCKLHTANYEVVLHVQPNIYLSWTSRRHGRHISYFLMVVENKEANRCADSSESSGSSTSGGNGTR